MSATLDGDSICLNLNYLGVVFLLAVSNESLLIWTDCFNIDEWPDNAD